MKISILPPHHLSKGKTKSYDWERTMRLLGTTVRTFTSLIMSVLSVRRKPDFCMSVVYLRIEKVTFESAITGLVS